MSPTLPGHQGPNSNLNPNHHPNPQIPSRTRRESTDDSHVNAFKSARRDQNAEAKQAAREAKVTARQAKSQPEGAEPRTTGTAAKIGKRIPRYFDIVVVAFVGFLLLSNITATKLIELSFGSLGHLVFDGGAILFPLTYILGDVLTEIYGLKRAKRAIYLGFAMSITAAMVFLLVQVAPPAADYHNQAAYEAVLGFVPRIVLASLLGYLFGQLLNALVLDKIRARLGENNMWIRLIGSTIVGEFADTLIFCTVAFYGVITGSEFLNYLITGYVYKVGVEVILLPLTYLVIGWFKRHEPGWVGKTDSNLRLS